VATLPVKKERGRIVVDAGLEVPAVPGLWAVRDCATVRDARTGEYCPPTAQHATREAACAARNIVAALRGGPKEAFAFTALGKMGSLGRRSAVAEVFGFKLSGFLAWWLWRTIYLLKLPGLDRKLRVATDWTLDLVLPPDIVRLKTDRALGVRREYFEPGQVIFREGDRGDWFYVVTEGEVEVLRTVVERGEVPVRRLGPGECFGEIALVSDTARSATVRAVAATSVLAVDREAFQAMFSSLPPLRGFVEQLIASRSA
jgi:NADH dehydrogenase